MVDPVGFAKTRYAKVFFYAVDRSSSMSPVPILCEAKFLVQEKNAVVGTRLQTNDLQI